MEFTVASIAFKADVPPARSPKAGEMVRVDGRRGLFVVTHVDRHQRTADLMQHVWKREVREQGIPWVLIRSISPQASRAIRQFLSSDLLESRTGPTTQSPSLSA